MNTFKKSNRYLLTGLVAVMLQTIAMTETFAQDILQSSIVCISRYEGLALGQDLNTQNYELLKAEQSYWPRVSAATTSGRNLAATPNTQSESWQVGASQLLYSRSQNFEIKSLENRVLLEKENLKSEIEQKSVQQLELMLAFLSSRERIEITKREIERRKKLQSLFETLNKTRLMDGSHVLLAEGGLLAARSRLSALETYVTSVLNSLKINPFFTAINLNRLIEKFKNSPWPERTAMVDANKRSEALALEYQKQSALAKLDSAKSAWLPRLDAGLTYSNEPGVPREALLSLSLTLPIDSFYRSGNETSFARTEAARADLVKTRTIERMRTESESEQKLIEALKTELRLLDESKTKLLIARDVIMKKLSLNRVSYFEVDNLDDLIDQTELQLLEKRLDLWRINMKWTTRRIMSKDLSVQTTCQ